MKVETVKIKYEPPTPAAPAAPLIQWPRWFSFFKKVTVTQVTHELVVWEDAFPWP